MFKDYFPVLLLLLASLGFVGLTLIVTHLLGPKRHGKRKDAAFECGIESVGDARTPISVHYFLVAILFVLFDVEIIFLYPWAVNFKALGTLGFLEVLGFSGLVLIGFFYVVKNKVLDMEGGTRS